MTTRVVRTSDLAACLAIRHAVFTVEQGVPEAEDIDGKDNSAIQLLAFAEGTPVGTARILCREGTGKIGRMAVLKSHRGLGIGQALLRQAIVELRKEPGISRAYLSSQSHAIGFYETLGFQAYGEDYDDVGIPHRDMELAL